MTPKKCEDCVSCTDDNGVKYCNLTARDCKEYDQDSDCLLYVGIKERIGL